MPSFFLSYKRAKVAGRMRLHHAKESRFSGSGAPDLKQTCRDPAQAPPESATKLPKGTRERKRSGASGKVQTVTGANGDEAVYGMGDVGGAGSGRHIGKCSDAGAN